MKNYQLFACLAILTFSTHSAFAQNAGDLDLSFNGQGFQFDSTSGGEQPFATVVMADGRIVVAGVWEPGVPPEFLVRRYQPDGRPDSTLGQAGMVHVPGHQISAGGTDVAIQTDHKILLIGTEAFTNEVIVQRLLENGSVDTSFATAGSFIIGQPFQFSFGNEIFVLPNGDIIFTLLLTESSAEYLASVRLKSDGSLDPSYGINGIARISFPFPLMRITASCLLADGSVVIVGAMDQISDQVVVISRLNSAGQLDLAFGNAGIVVLPPNSFEMDVFTIAEDQTGDYYLSGYRANSPIHLEVSVRRLFASGQLDSLYGQGGEWVIGNTGFDYAVQALVVDATGNLILAGSIADSSERFFVARGLPTGQIDPSFGVGGSVAFSMGVPQSAAMVAALQSDCKLVVAGYALQPGLAIYTAVARLWMGNPLAITQATGKVQARLFPNPTLSGVNLTWETKKAGSWNWAIHNTHGKLVMESVQGQSLPAGLHSFEIDLATVDAGVYLLTLSTEGLSSTFRVVRQ